MKLQTQIPLKPQQQNQIDYNAKLMLLGSCFSENIGEQFEYFKFQSTVNPFGILFHPLAIQNLIARSVSKTYYSEADLCFHNEQWSCLDAHSKLNQTSKEALLGVLNSQLDKTIDDLRLASHVIITLGTSWVYKHIESDKVVANCHKIPQKEFKKELLSVAEIVASFKTIVSSVKSINPDVKFLFTVSPVRHLKDGFVENTQSKAHLIAGIHEFLNQESLKSESQSFYFPSYEIMMDELRDYRFYNADMLHPNAVAINYIWEKFKMVWLSKDAVKTTEAVDIIQKGLQHRPFNSGSEAHQKFLKNLESKIEILQEQYPYMVF